MYDLKRGTQFLQRIGAIPCHVQPQPAIETSALQVHFEKLESPLPLPQLVITLAGEPPPDVVKTEEWPHP